jgi:phosphopantetheine adenylyltransferase
MATSDHGPTPGPWKWIGASLIGANGKQVIRDWDGDCRLQDRRILADAPGQAEQIAALQTKVGELTAQVQSLERALDQIHSGSSKAVPLARTHGPVTSRDAAEKIVACLVGLERQVFEYIRAQGEHGATNFEIVAATGIKLQTVTPRSSSLVRKGLVYPTGKTRRNDAGNAAGVFAVCRFGGDVDPVRIEADGQTAMF